MGLFDGLDQEYYGVSFVRQGKSVLFSPDDLLEIVQQFVKLKIDNLKFQDISIIEPNNYIQFNSGYTPYNIRTWLALAEYIKQKELKQDDAEVIQITINCGGRAITIFNPWNRDPYDYTLGYQESDFNCYELVQKAQDSNISGKRIINMIRLLLAGHIPPVEEKSRFQNDMVHEELREMPEALPCLVVTLFGSEASKNPMSFIPALMLLDLIENNGAFSFNDLIILFNRENNYELSRIIIAWLAQYRKNYNQDGINLHKLSQSEFKEKQPKQLISPFYFECRSIIRDSIAGLIEKFCVPKNQLLPNIDEEGIDSLDEIDEKLLCTPCASKDDFLDMLPFFELKAAYSIKLNQSTVADESELSYVFHKPCFTL